MNDVYLEQPLTSTDVNAVMTALSNPNSPVAAKQAMLKMVYMVASSMNNPNIGITSHDLCRAIAAGASDVGTTALFDAVALETSIFGSWGGVIVQAAGVIQIISWVENAAAWLVAKMESLATIFAAAASSALLIPGSGVSPAALALKAFLSFFGIGQNGVQKDSKNVMQAINIMATSSAPVLAMALQGLSTSAGSMTIPQNPSGSGAAGSGAGSISASQTTSPSGGSASPTGSRPAGSGQNPTSPTGSQGASDRKRRDTSAIGIRSARSLVRLRA